MLAGCINHYTAQYDSTLCVYVCRCATEGIIVFPIWRVLELLVRFRFSGNEFNSASITTTKLVPLKFCFRYWDTIVSRCTGLWYKYKKRETDEPWPQQEQEPTVKVQPTTLPCLMRLLGWHNYRLFKDLHLKNICLPPASVLVSITEKIKGWW